MSATKEKLMDLPNQAHDALEKVVDNVSELSTTQKAVAAGVGIAAVSAAAGMAIRQANKRSAASLQEAATKTYHLEPAGEDWRITVEGISGAAPTFATKEEALTEARQLAKENSPSELVVHLSDGSEQKRHSYGIEAHAPT